ncbi:hypothetical protein NC652_011437 [Populus alba x Populus x berolinensis]|nr:hypothetical protein NC652_011437 [Populus alba x Populus x berolinensis]
MNDSSRNVNGSEPHFLWKRRKPVKCPTRYNLTEKLPPTDSRRRTDHRCLENGAYAKAKEEKLRLNQRQLRTCKYSYEEVNLQHGRCKREVGSPAVSEGERQPNLITAMSTVLGSQGKGQLGIMS